MNCSLSPGLTWPNICPIIYDKDIPSNHEQSEINRSDDIPILSPGSTWPNICFSDFPKMLIPESHERILRRIIRRFGSFPTRTYSNRSSNDANVRITYEERSERVLNLNKTCA